MRDFFRLLTVAVLSFALVGVALVYSRDSTAISGVLDVISANIAMPANRANGQASRDDEEQATRLWIERPNQDVWMGIAGFPDQYELRFPIPPGISYVRGQLELTFDAQLAEKGDGRMTIAVNGVRRGEIVLNQGLQTHEVAIALTTDELLGRWLDVTLAGTGTTNGGRICPTNAANSGSAVTLLPSSGLALYTNAPADSARIRLASLAEPMSLALGDMGSDQAAAIWGSQVLARAGIDTSFVQSEGADLAIGPAGGNALGLDTDGRIVLAGRAGIDEMIAGRAEVLAAPSLPHAWPVTAEALGAETTVKSFRGSRRWTLPYKLADLGSGRMPTRLDLALKASILEDGADWVVRVSLNGNLLETRRFAGTVDTIAMPVALPADKQGLRNEITIELIDASPNDSICRAGLDAQAQLLPSTGLVADGDQPDEGWGAMVRALAGVDTVGLIVEGDLSVAEARQAKAMLAAFLPANTEMMFGTDVRTARVQVTILEAAQLQTSLVLADRLAMASSRNGSGALVTLGGRRGTELSLTALSDQHIEDVIGGLSPTSVAILLTPN